jgi:hypothetical protein
MIMSNLALVFSCSIDPGTDPIFQSISTEYWASINSVFVFKIKLIFLTLAAKYLNCIYQGVIKNQYQCIIWFPLRFSSSGIVWVSHVSTSSPKLYLFPESIQLNWYVCKCIYVHYVILLQCKIKFNVLSNESYHLELLISLMHRWIPALTEPSNFPSIFSSN